MWACEDKETLTHFLSFPLSPIYCSLSLSLSLLFEAGSASGLKLNSLAVE